jgi:hypothetical protein
MNLMLGLFCIIFGLVMVIFHRPFGRAYGYVKREALDLKSARDEHGARGYLAGGIFLIGLGMYLLFRS